MNTGNEHRVLDPVPTEHFSVDDMDPQDCNTVSCTPLIVWYYPYPIPFGTDRTQTVSEGRTIIRTLRLPFETGFLPWHPVCHVHPDATVCIVGNTVL